NFLTILLDALNLAGLSSRLKEDIVEYLLLDFHLWVYTPFAVQKQLLTKVIPFALSAIKNSRRIISLKRILEIVRTFYWTEKTSDSVSKEDILDGIKSTVRPSLSDLGLLRGYFYHIMN